MTLNSIIADVHELRAYYSPCQVRLPQRLYTRTQRWHQHSPYISQCALSVCTSMMFVALIDDHSLLGGISSVGAV